MSLHAFLRRLGRPAAALAGLVLVATLVPGPSAGADAVTRVFLDGQAVPVYFSDGDSFRFLGGPHSGRNTRIAGFNTLESYGPVHQWGDWHPYELYVNAKQATLNARRGVWHCTTDGEPDTYGRLLVECPDLAVDQIRKGLAHAMNVDDAPARPEYLRAQRSAIAARRGMWAHGVPAFVLTSIHSITEDPSNERAYNRMVSTRDGHSEKWGHTDTYAQCTWQCATEVVADEGLVRDAARRLRADASLGPAVGELPNLLLVEVVDRYARMAQLPEWLSADQVRRIEPQLRQARQAGALGQAREQRGACVLYIAFERRYGRLRPSCLRGHGEPPP